jgi:hypothetical protein
MESERDSGFWFDALAAQDVPAGGAGLFPLGFFQLPIDPKLDPPDRKQIELGFGLARDDPLADAELPFPNARSDRRHGEFNALVGHIKIPPRPPTAQIRN